eukprot:327411-Amphidinium_carterae.1
MVYSKTISFATFSRHCTCHEACVSFCEISARRRGLSVTAQWSIQEGLAGYLRSAPTSHPLPRKHVDWQLVRGCIGAGTASRLTLQHPVSEVETHRDQQAVFTRPAAILRETWRGSNFTYVRHECADRQENSDCLASIDTLVLETTLPHSDPVWVAPWHWLGAIRVADAAANADHAST